MKKCRYCILLPVLFVLGATAAGETCYVDLRVGSDRYSGRSPEVRDHGNGPFRTIRHAIDVARPGDVIQLVPHPGPDVACVNFRNRSGTPDKPIVFDGRMSVLRGSEIIPPEKWRPAGKELFKFPVKLKPNVLLRYFLVFDGKINRMGRTLKGTSAKWKAVGELKAGEWTYSEADKAVFVKLPSGKTPKDYKIAAPVVRLPSGVSLGGKCRNLVIRNLVVEQFWNDGCNIHNDCKNIRFENIMARDNGDDGISAHETCEISVENFISSGNGTGICHVGDSRSENTNVLICGIAGRELLMKNSMNCFSNMIVLGNSARGVDIAGDKVEMTNIRFVNERPGVVPAILKMNRLTCENTGFYHYSVQKSMKTLSGELREEADRGKWRDPIAEKTIARLRKIFGKHFPEIKIR